MILVGGENLIDFIQIEAPEGNPVYQANPGGSPYNCAKALGRQDVDVEYISPISTDTLGGLLADGLVSAGVRLRAPRRAEPTSLAVVSLQEGQASYQFYRDNTAERMVDFETLLSQVPVSASAFHLGSLAITGGVDAEVWVDFFEAMKGRGVLTSLDPNVRPVLIGDRTSYMDRFHRLLACTDLLKLSDEDIAWLYPDLNLTDAAAQMAEISSATMVVVTKGADGSDARWAGKTVSVGAARVKQLRDTVGAGDTFMATLLAGLERSDQLNASRLGELEPEAVEALLTRASLAAALNCEQAGCVPPTLSELERTL